MSLMSDPNMCRDFILTNANPLLYFEYFHDGLILESPAYKKDPAPKGTKSQMQTCL